MDTPTSHPSTIRSRRVVAGQTPDGHSTIVSDDVLESSAFAGGSALFVWGHDDAVAAPNDGATPPWDGAFPPVGGSRLSFSHFLPGQVEEYDQFVASVAPDPVPGMHRTDTLDYLILVSGTLTMELDDGTSVVLHPTDVVIQNGTRHRWANYGDTPAVLMAVSIGATPQGTNS